MHALLSGDRALILLVLASMAALSACSEPQTPAAPKAVAPSAAEKAPAVANETPVVPLSAPAREMALPDRKVFPRTAGSAVDMAIYMGAYKAMEGLSRTLDPRGGTHAGAPSRVKDSDRPKGKLLTFWYTGNVRGEREDCGCKKNPRGGLTRKSTIIKNAPKAGRDIDKPDGQLILDAGDLLFAGLHVGRFGENDRKVAHLRAESIVESFNKIGCHGFVPGEYDVTLGADVLMELKGKAKFPWISANLRKAGQSELLLPAFSMAEAGGMKILVVGLTNNKSANKDHFTRAGVEVDEPLAALRAQADAIRGAGADAVVLLSNLGMDETIKLIGKLDPKKLPISAALVSGSARSVYSPVWAGAVPVMEPGSRGKMLGRLDMHIVDGKVAFTPGESSEVRAVRDYMNAYRSLHHARRSVANIPVDSKNEARDKRIRRNLDLATTRLTKVEGTLPATLVAEKGTGEETESWLHHQVVPVELEVDQDQAVRRLLDGYERKVAPLLPKPKPKLGGKVKGGGTPKHVPPKAGKK